DAGVEEDLFDVEQASGVQLSLEAGQLITHSEVQLEDIPIGQVIIRILTATVRHVSRLYMGDLLGDEKIITGSAFQLVLTQGVDQRGGNDNQAITEEVGLV